MVKTMTAKSPLVPPPSPRFVTVAEAIVEQLQLWGVTRIYGVVGDAIFGLMDALAKQEQITFIAVKHESVAAMMASAEAKLTGRLGVCAAQMGPGLANLLNGLGDAFLDKAPVLAISGQAPLDKIGTSYKQFINQQQMVKAISSYSELIAHPDAILKSLAQAMRTSVLQKTVSHLSVPTDVFALPTMMKPFEKLPLSTPFVDSPQFEQALQIIQAAKQPVMLVGSRVRIQAETLQALAEAWGCGIVMSYGAKGIVSNSHPYMLDGLGEGGNPFVGELFKHADTVLTIDTAWWPEDLVPLKARVVQIANDPMELEVSVSMDAGLVGDSASIVAKLLSGLKQHVPNPDWIQQIKQCQQAWFAQNESERNQISSPLHPASIIKAIEQQIAEDTVITLDVGDSMHWFLRNFQAKRQHVLLSERWLTMGFGLPAALAAKLISPEKQVVCITGDGGLEMVMADLLTAVRYNLQITVIVFNNGALQMERDKMFMKGLQPEGTKLTNPDFAKVAEACGWNSFRIETLEQLEAALQQSLSANKPVLLDVLTANIPHPDFKMIVKGG
ncbi:thiamine pyrophosphate-binding protein [Gorillibacterium massiliense]|uniref:thiamine pyrophosphate-binding protein n=1 Tax=Gorillibacterium massiliense TaxID=1280390 RepID=UPI0004B7986A|nr:thiamine pyrophosphate-binding protein [Gorillibacterium massiliense]